MKRKFLYLVLAGCILSSLAFQPKSDAPLLMSYQGRLTDASGSPRNGSCSMTFAFYDAVTAGNALPAGSPWTETQNVQVTNGIFHVVLGSVTAMPANLFSGGPADAAGPLRFLQVTVAGEALSPRTRIVSVPYAISADTARFAETPTVPGPPGPTGPQGPQGPQGPVGPVGALKCTSMVQNFTGTIEMNCPSGYTAVLASCNSGVSFVIQDLNSPLQPPDTAWVWYLIPNKDAATGVHCQQPPLVIYQVRVRCCKTQ
jgi:hypothetical protein